MPIPPTYEDAELVLRLYDLRREEKLRAAREWFRTDFFPGSYDDVRAVTSTNGPENTSFRMVTGYWDMACSFVAHGILHPEIFFESGGEALFVWAKLGPFVADLRRDQKNPRVLANLEKAIALVPGAAERVAVIRERLVAMRERYRK
jgi:hypothetical protein